MCSPLVLNKNMKCILLWDWCQKTRNLLPWTHSSVGLGIRAPPGSCPDREDNVVERKPSGTLSCSHVDPFCSLCPAPPPPYWSCECLQAGVCVWGGGSSYLMHTCTLWTHAIGHMRAWWVLSEVGGCKTFVTYTLGNPEKWDLMSSHLPCVILANSQVLALILWECQILNPLWIVSLFLCLSASGFSV